MAITATTRLGLNNWGAGTDKLTRAQANADHANLDAKAMMRQEAPLASRPAAGKGGSIFLATDTHVAYYDNGASWEVVGRVVEGTHVVNMLTGQVNNLEEFRSPTNVLMSFVDTAGKFNGAYTDPNYPKWVRPSTGLKPFWSELNPSLYPVVQHRSGDNVAVRGALTLATGALAPAFLLDAPYIPLHTQFFPSWYYPSANYLTGTVGAVAAVVGTADGPQFFGPPGTVSILPALGGGAIAVNYVIHLNLNYQVGGVFP